MENNIELPPIYKRNGRDCYLDPIRQKLIYITPEETVRQTVISYLVNEVHVPKQMLLVEEHLSHYGIKSKKRADIIIHKLDTDDKLAPVAIVECKAPDVRLDEKALEQLMGYCDAIGVDYALLTNGEEKISIRYNPKSDNYMVIESLPSYNDILSDTYKEMPLEELPPRIKFEDIQKELEEEFASYEEDYFGEYISKQTPMNLACATFNLMEGLFDTRVKMPTGDYGLFKLIEDYGIRMVTYGNAGGGQFFGPYRSFLVDVDGTTEFFSIGMSTYIRTNKPDHVKTCISVAHDDEKEAHHALQLVVDDNLICMGNRVDFYHHGKIAIGNKGSGKIDELRMFVDSRYPKIIRGNRFYLGSLVNDRLWRLDDPEVIEVIANLISYSIIRDEYREFVKNN
ncbi:MAG: type I restriction enzyme HsdR N-terminal domain-containing protein [Clostridiales bacterium]|nr:type I restriction enzyme HsdR N-terminal domain-containing protein [Clostridiales bacterium]